MSLQQNEDKEEKDITEQSMINNVFLKQESYDLNSQDASDIEHENYSYRQINLNNVPFHNNYTQQTNNFLDSPSLKKDQQQQLDSQENQNQASLKKFERNSLTEVKQSQELNPVIVMEELIQQTRNEFQNQIDFKNQVSLIEHFKKAESDDESSEDNENKIVQISAEQRRSLIREERYKEMEKFIDRNVDKYDNESQDEEVSILIDQDSIQFKNRDKSGNKQPQSTLMKTGRQNNDVQKRCVSNPRGQRFNANVRDSIQKSDQLSIKRQQKTTFNTKHNQISVQKRKKKKLVFNTYFTIYPVIDLAAKNVGFQTQYKDHLLVPSAQVKAAYRIAPGIYANISPEEFDVVWFDCPTRDDVFQKLKPYQRINQIPGIQILSSKARLARNLNYMIRQFPDEYNFFPRTYLLPQEIQEFRRTVTSLNIKKDVFIVKPSHQCQGKGIHLVKNWEDYQEEQNLNNGQVAQLYLDDPYLIDGLKFDLRIYVLIFGIHPLRIYIYNDGLARFATTPYESVQTGDIKNLFMHLTNYSINKNSQNYVQNENFDGGTGTTQDIHQNFQKIQERDVSCYGQTGGIEEQTQTKKLPHKRSLKQIYSQIKEQSGQETDKLEKDIEDLIIKTIITGQPHLHQTYKNLIPDDIENQHCFQLLGFDVMIDSKLKPWLIEINQSPSFATDSAFDFKLKKKLMEDTFKLLNLSMVRKNQYQQVQERSQFDRLMSSTKKTKPNFQEKEFERYQIDIQRDKIELQILMEGEYKFIFPVKNQVPEINQYVQFLRSSKEIYYYINGKKSKSKEENIYDMFLRSQLTKRLERQQTFSQIKNVYSQNQQEIQNKFIKISEKKKDLIKTTQTVELLKKEQVTLFKPGFDEIQKQNNYKSKNLGKTVFGNQNENKIEIQTQNIESQNKAASDIKKKIGLTFEFSKNPYIISSKNFENYNQRLKDLNKAEFSNKFQYDKQNIDGLNQSPKLKQRPLTSNQRNSGLICKTPSKYQNLAKFQNNYQKILHENRISLNFQAQSKKQIIQKTEKKEQKNKIINTELTNNDLIKNYNEKKNQYKQTRVNNKINADLTSAIHSVDFTNKKSYISKNFNSFLEQKSNQSNIGEPKNQVKDENNKQEKIQNDFNQSRKSFDISPTFEYKNQYVSKSPFTIQKQKYQQQEASLSVQIYNGFQKELERLQKIEKVLKKDAVSQKQPSDDLIQDNIPYQYKTPQRIKKLIQNLEKSTPEIGSVTKISQKIFSVAVDQQKNSQHTKIQGNIINLQDQNQKDKKSENKKLVGSQSTNRNLQNSQKQFKTLDNKLDYQIFNNKRKAQDILDVKIQVVETFRKNNDKQNDTNIQQIILNVEDPGKIFKKMIETQKSNGCDPVFDLQKDFKFEKNIGEGAYSDVKKVIHIQSGYKVAIKTYEKSQLRRKSQLMAIHREIYILAKMDHPNIMKLYEVLDSNTHVSLVLQLCPGMKLNEYLQKYGTKGRIGINNNTTSYLSESKSKYIFRQIVEAVNYMHLQGIVHRDLRIETIIISESNSKIKMVDFGFATSFDFKFQVPGTSTESHEDLASQLSKGTEIVKNKLISCQQQDCYNLGIILFILLTGGLPVWAQIESEIYQKIIAPKNCLPLSQSNNRGYDNFSKECQDLINRLFNCDQLSQITLQEVLKSEWLSQNKN